MNSCYVKTKMVEHGTQVFELVCIMGTYQSQLLSIALYREIVNIHRAVKRTYMVTMYRGRIYKLNIK